MTGNNYDDDLNGVAFFLGLVMLSIAVGLCTATSSADDYKTQVKQITNDIKGLELDLREAKEADPDSTLVEVYESALAAEKRALEIALDKYKKELE